PGEEVKAGRLREELAHALGTLVLAVPPLRQRRADLPWLVERLLARLGVRGGAAVQGLAEDAWGLGNPYAWPGDLRELSRAPASAGEKAAGERLPAAELRAYIRLAVRLEQTPGRPPERPLPLDKLLEDVERRLIELALRRFDGNKTRAAQHL